MSYYLLDFDKNDSSYNLDNIIIDDKIILNEENFKYPIYYNDNHAKEFYIKTPKIRLIYDWSKLKYSQLKIRITPKYEKTENFIKIIADLENKVLNHNGIKKKKKLEFNSIITEENSINYLKVFYNENTIKITSDVKNKDFKINEFKANSEIQLIIKIPSIWQKNGKYGLSANVYQIKYFAPPEYHDLDFFDIEKPIKNIIKEKEFDSHNFSSSPPPPKADAPPFPRFAINPSMLQSIKLKPVD